MRYCLFSVSLYLLDIGEVEDSCYGLPPMRRLWKETELLCLSNINHEHPAWVGGVSPTCMRHWGRGPLVTHPALWHEKQNTANTCSVLFTYFYSITKTVRAEKELEHGQQLPEQFYPSHPWHKKACEVQATKLPLLLCFSCIPLFCIQDHPPPQTASHSSSHPRNITWHASQGRSMILALFIPSVLAIRLLPFPISPLGPLSVTYIRSFHFQRDDRAIKWTANDRQSGTSPLALSPPRECGRQLNQSCYMLSKAKKGNTSQSIRIQLL